MSQPLIRVNGEVMQLTLEYIHMQCMLGHHRDRLDFGEGAGTGIKEIPNLAMRGAAIEMLIPGCENGQNVLNYSQR